MPETAARGIPPEAYGHILSYWLKYRPTAEHPERWVDPKTGVDILYIVDESTDTPVWVIRSPRQLGGFVELFRETSFFYAHSTVTWLGVKMTLDINYAYECAKQESKG